MVVDSGAEEKELTVTNPAPDTNHGPVPYHQR